MTSSTGKSPGYYQRWAERINAAFAIPDDDDAAFTAWDVVVAERRMGKDIGASTPADWQAFADGWSADAVMAQAEADLVNADTEIVVAAMRARRAETVNDLQMMLRESDVDYVEVTDALIRQHVRLSVESDEGHSR